MGHAGKPFKLTAVLIMVAMNFLIIVSTFAFCLETIPKYSADVETRAHYLKGSFSEADPTTAAAEWEQSPLRTTSHPAAVHPSASKDAAAAHA